MKIRLIITMVAVFAIVSCSETEENETPINHSRSKCERIFMSQGAQFLKNAEDNTVDWFLITKEKCLENREYRIRQYFGGQDCRLHWDGVFVADKGDELDLQTEYRIVPLCHHEFCTLEQNGKKIVLHFKSDFKPCTELIH